MSIGHAYIEMPHHRGMAKIDERTVWERVKEALADAGLRATQMKAAEIAGCSQPSVSEWNQRGSYPEIKHAEKIAKRTNTAVEWIYSGRGPKHPGPPEDPDAESLWNLWARLSESTRGRIVGMAEESLHRSVAARPASSTREKSGILQRR